MANPTFDGVRREATKLFMDAGIDTAAQDARILLTFASGKRAAELIASGPQTVDDDIEAMFRDFITRRLAKEPTAYITGQQAFWSLELRVNKHVLIPRPETEGVVEHALAVLKNHEHARILDVGTGCGAILISLLHELPTAKGCGVDISKPALKLAQTNVKLLGVADRCTFATSDFLQGVRGRYDIVVANPPYITDAAMGVLPPDVGLYEPHLALQGGPDGLSAYTSIIKDLPNVLTAGGHVVFEIGYDQKTAVCNLLKNAGATNIICHQDLAGHDRIISATFY